MRITETVSPCIAIYHGKNPLYMVQVSFVNQTIIRRSYRDLDKAIEVRDMILKSRRKFERKRRLSMIKKEAFIIEQFIGNGLTQQEIKKQFNLNHSTISTAITKYFKPSDGVIVTKQSRV